jgi:hypothetical protein
MSSRISLALPGETCAVSAQICLLAVDQEVDHPPQVPAIAALHRRFAGTGDGRQWKPSNDGLPQLPAMTSNSPASTRSRRPVRQSRTSLERAVTARCGSDARRWPLPATRPAHLALATKGPCPARPKGGALRRRGPRSVRMSARHAESRRHAGRSRPRGLGRRRSPKSRACDSTPIAGAARACLDAAPTPRTCRATALRSHPHGRLSVL